MVARLLAQPNLIEQWAERRVGPRPAAVVLPFLRPKASTPAQIDCFAKYPSTRMHGAAFEAEFYPTADEQF